MSSTVAVTKENLFTRIAVDYWQGLKNLLTCPREIWIAYLIQIFEGFCYFASVLVLMPFMINDMGFSDVKAGTIFGIFSASMSLFMLFVGFVADSLGIKKALIVGCLIALVGRVAITFSTNPTIVYPGLFFLSVGFAYMIPLIPGAIKYFTTKKAQKFSYSWYYVVMNIGSLVAGLSRDGLRSTFREVTHFHVFGFDLAVRPLQMIFFASAVATIISLLLVIFFIRNKIPRSAFKDEPATEVDHHKTEAERGPEKKKQSAWQVMIETGREKIFWIFILFIFMLVLVKMAFQYNHSLYPVYMERIGLDDWTGKLYSINPFLIIFLVPVFTAITARMNAYKTITFGAFVTAAATFILGLGETIAMVVAFQVVLSLGEAIWSPRLYDYAATIAPKGKEATYMAYSKAPMFFAKVAAGPITGLLLYHFCPAEGVRHSGLMWSIVGLSMLISPIVLLLGRKWLDVEYHKERLEKAKA